MTVPELTTHARQDPDAVKAVTAHTALGRLGEAEDIAGVASWLPILWPSLLVPVPGFPDRFYSDTLRTATIRRPPFPMIPHAVIESLYSFTLHDR